MQMTLKQAVKLAQAMRKRGYKVQVGAEARTVETKEGTKVVENYYVR